MADQNIDANLSVTGKITQTGTPSASGDVITKGYADANFQAADTDLTSLASRWTSRTTTVPDRLQFFEGSNNGSNVVEIQPPSSLAANATVTLPSSTGTLALQSAVDAKQDADADLTTIAGLTATTDNVIQSVSGAWASRTPAQLKTTLALVKGDVGLGNVDNTSDATKNSATATLTNKTISGANNTLSAIPQSAVTNLATDLAAKAAKAPTVNIVAATGSTEAIDWTTEVHDLTMDQNCTFTFSNIPASGTFGSIVVILRGAFTPTLPASVDWPDATPPSYGSPAIYVFSTRDGGTTVFGSQVGKSFG